VDVIGVNHYYRSVVGFGVNRTFFGGKDEGAGAARDSTHPPCPRSSGTVSVH
jgi:hypothetical protein